MTKVKLITSLAWEDKIFPAGKIVDLEEGYADHLIHIGSAIEADDNTQEDVVEEQVATPAPSTEPTAEQLQTDFDQAGVEGSPHVPPTS